MLTAEYIPFEDNFIPGCSELERKVVFIARDKATGKISRYRNLERKHSELYWEVIDPVNGVCYDTIFRRANDVWNDHRAMYPGSPNYTIGTVLKYYYTMKIIKKRLVFRIWRYHPVAAPGEYGLYETFRLVFYKNTAVEENRGGTVKSLTASKVWSKNSIYKKIKPLDRDGSKKVRSGFDRKLTKYGKSLLECDVDYMDKILEMNMAEWLSPLFVADKWLKSCHKQHFNSNVPKEMIRHLSKDKSVPLEGYLVLEYQDQRCYIGKTHRYFFKRYFTGQWNSSNVRNCYGLVKVPPVRLNIDLRSYKKLIKGTMYEGCIYNRLYTNRRYNPGFLYILDLQRKYLSVEQALKIGRDDIVRMLIYVLNEQGRYKGKWIDRNIILPDDSLPDVFGISGAQLKFVGYIEQPYNFLRNFKGVINGTQQYIPSAELRIRLGVCECRYVMNICRRYLDYKKDPQPFFKALVKYDSYDIQKIANQYSDYLYLLRKDANFYIENHPEDGLPYLPEFVKPSNVTRYHDIAAHIMNMQTAIRAEEQTKALDNVIISQKTELADIYEYRNSRFQLTLPEDMHDIMLEGTRLGHCVSGYIRDVAAKRTTILFLRKITEPATSFFTMEVFNGRITQLFGYHNTFNREPEIADFIEDYAKNKGFQIDCTIIKQ